MSKASYKDKHVNFFNLNKYDEIESAISHRKAEDFHHLNFKKSGGRPASGLDEAWNTIALTREEHQRAHHDREFNEYLKRRHFKRLVAYVGERLDVQYSLEVE